MKRRMNYIITVIILISVILSGCSTKKSSQSTEASDTKTTSAASQTTGYTTEEAIVSASSTIKVDKQFSSKDLEVGYDEDEAVAITLNNTSADVTGKGVTVKDNVITINKAGTYLLSGTLDDGQIVVDAGDSDKVHIIFNGVTINCSSSAPVYIKNAEKVFLTLEAGTVNTLTDTDNYVQNDNNTVDGVIYSKADLSINGDGTLNITGNYKHGITVKNQLTITSGTYNISAVKDAINGNEGLRIKAGTFNLSSQKGNGISIKNKKDTTKGFVYICGGEINVTSCVEGIEGTAILIEGGSITINAQDDGFNSSNGTVSSSEDFQNGGDTNPFENDENCYISFSGGTINVNASGDGIDSNGSLYISGGTIYVSGPTENNNGGLDYNGTADITGGTIIVAGSSGMAQGFSDTSTQYSLLYNLSSVSSAGTEVTLTDSDGNTVAAFTPAKQYQSVVISTPQLKEKGVYTLTSGDQTAEITLSSMVTSNATNQQMGGPQMGGGQGGQQPGGGDAMTKPDSTDSNTGQ